MLSEENYKLLKDYCNPCASNAGERFEQLKKQKLIKIHSYKAINLNGLGQFSAPDKWIITELGKDALAEFENKYRQEAEIRKKQYRHDWKIAIFSTLGGAVAGFITSLLFWILTK